ncbi:MAG: hypothetical protein ACJA16_004959, partial [Akkermansiaceae bacterium]
MIIGVNVVALLFDVLEKFAKGGVVFIGDEMWLGDDGGAVLEIDKAVGTFEMEFDLLRVEEMKYRDIVLAKAEVLEGLAEFVGIDEEIGKDDDKGALLDFFGNLVKSR